MRAKTIELEKVKAQAIKLEKLMNINGFLQYYKPLTVFACLYVSTFCAIIAYSIYHFRNNITTMFENIYNLFTTICLPCDVLVGFFYSVEMKILMKGCYLSYDYDSSVMRSKIEKIEEKSAKTMKKLVKTMVYLSSAILLNLSLPALIRALLTRSVRGIVIFPTWLPYTVDTIPLSLLTIVLQEVCLILKQSTIFGGYALVYLVYSHIKTETEMLNYAMEHIDERAKEMARTYKSYGDGMEQRDGKILERCYNRCMTQCAQHHSELLKYFFTSIEPCKYIFAILFGTGSISCSLAAYFIISDNIQLRIKYCAMAGILLFYIYTIFLLGEAVTTIFATIADVAYGMDWLKLPKESQSTLKIMLIKANQPIFYVLNTGHPIDMETYMVMLKATYYYVNIMVTT